MLPRVAICVYAKTAKRTKTKWASSGATNVKATGAILVAYPRNFIFVRRLVAPESSVKTAATTSIAIIAMKSTAQNVGYTANAAIMISASLAMRSITNARKCSSTSHLHHKIRQVNTNVEDRETDEQNG